MSVPWLKVIQILQIVWLIDLWSIIASRASSSKKHIKTRNSAVSFCICCQGFYFVFSFSPSAVALSMLHMQKFQIWTNWKTTTVSAFSCVLIIDILQNFNSDSVSTDEHFEHRQMKLFLLGLNELRSNIIWIYYLIIVMRISSLILWKFATLIKFNNNW